jgi:hypothetical protein
VSCFRPEKHENFADTGIGSSPEGFRRRPARVWNTGTAQLAAAQRHGPARCSSGLRIAHRTLRPLIAQEP